MHKGEQFLSNSAKQQALPFWSHQFSGQSFRGSFIMMKQKSMVLLAYLNKQHGASYALQILLCKFENVKELDPLYVLINYEEFVMHLPGF